MDLAIRCANHRHCVRGLLDVRAHGGEDVADGIARLRGFLWPLGIVMRPPATAAAAINGVALDRSGSMRQSRPAIGPG